MPVLRGLAILVCMAVDLLGLNGGRLFGETSRLASGFARSAQDGLRIVVDPSRRILRITVFAA